MEIIKDEDVKKIIFHVTVFYTCPECNGNGTLPGRVFKGAIRKCPKCKGHGTALALIAVPIQWVAKMLKEMV